VIPSLPRRAALATLLCLTAFTALLPGCGRAPSSARDPETAANTFFAALEQGDPHAAYDSGAFGFQAAQTFTAFISNARELGLVGGQPPAWTRKDVNGTEARLTGTLVSQSGQPINIAVTLTLDDKDWKLFSLQTSTASREAEPENRFTLVGKGAGFNDVYHQPMPGPGKLADLVHETMASFNKAILTGDFHEFFLSVSQQWKNGERMSGDAASGVTEKMLKTHFQPFTDKKIDLSVVAGLPPVFDRPPQINQDGLLVLHGHFDDPQYRVNFNMEFAYELPRWKLFGIDVDIVQ